MPCNNEGNHTNILDRNPEVDGILALDLWDVVIEVLRSTNDTARQ